MEMQLITHLAVVSRTKRLTNDIGKVLK